MNQNLEKVLFLLYTKKFIELFLKIKRRKKTSRNWRFFSFFQVRNTNTKKLKLIYKSVVSSKFNRLALAIQNAYFLFVWVFLWYSQVFRYEIIINDKCSFSRRQRIVKVCLVSIEMYFWSLRIRLYALHVNRYIIIWPIVYVIATIKNKKLR